MGKRARRAFTLIELLVSLTGILIVMALMLSVFGSARKAADSTKSVSNLKQLYLSAHRFSQDNLDSLPPITCLYPKAYNGMGYTGALDAYGAKDVKVDPAARDLRIFGYGMNMNLCPSTLQWPVNGHEVTTWGRNHERFWYHSCFKWRNIFRPQSVILFAATAGRGPDQEVAWYYGEYNTMTAQDGATRADRHQKGMIQIVACDGHVQMLPLSELSRQSPRSEWWTNGPEGFIPTP